MEHQKLDRELLDLFSDPSRQEEAFTMITRQYSQPLYHVIRRMLNNHEDTDDVLQNTFIKIYKGLDKFNGESKLFTWMYRIAINESKTFLTKANKKRSMEITDHDFLLENETGSTDGLSEDHIWSLLQKAINQLPNKQQMVFRMRYLDSLSYKEISNILGISEGGLKASYHHAVKKVEAFIKTQAIV